MTEVEFYESAFNPIYWEYLTKYYSYELYVGTAGSGKSWFVAQKQLYKCLNENNYRLVFCRKTAESIRDSQFQMFCDLIHKHNLDDIFTINLSQMDIKCANGNMMLSAGLDNPYKIKSITNVTDIWIEEALGNEIEKPVESSDFDQLNLRLRAEKGQPLSFTMTYNPVDEDSWINKRFHTGNRLDSLEQAKTPNTLILWTSYKDNIFIDQIEYAEKLNQLEKWNDNYYKIYALGLWGKRITGHEFYSSFNYLTHVTDVPILRDVPVHISFDQNVVPYITATLYQIVKRGDVYEVRQFAELCLENPKNKTENLCDEIIFKYEEELKAGVYFYGDATGRKRDTRSKENDYDIVERVMRRFLNNRSNKVPVSNPNVKRRRDFMNKLLSGIYPIRFIIDKSCEKSIADFENVKEDVDGTKLKKATKDKVSGISYEKYGHCSDTADYLLCEVFKSFFIKN